MTENPYDIVAINRTRGYSLLRNQTICHWSKTYDRYGNLTYDLTEAVTAVHELPNGKWVTLDLSQWETVTLH